MAVIQDEQGNSKPIKTDTSHVFDVNGNPLHGELFIGETIASDDVEEIDGFAHESDVNAISQNLAEYQKKEWTLVSTLTGTTAGTYPASGDYSEFMVVFTTSAGRINSVVLPYSNSFYGRLSVMIYNEVYEIFFNRQGGCQGSNANATYQLYYR